MATRLTEKQEAAACRMAAQVYAGRLTKTEGVSRLVADDGLNKSTAAIFIEIYKCLLQGKEFRRTTSAAAMGLLLQGIQATHGAPGLAKATAALRAHIAYFERHYDTTMTKMRVVLTTFGS